MLIQYLEKTVELDNIISYICSFSTTSGLDVMNNSNFYLNENGIFVTNSLPNDGKFANSYPDA